MKTKFTMGQIAKIVRVAPRTVSMWFDRGILRGYQEYPSRNRVVLRADLEQFLTDHGLPAETIGQWDATAPA